jgi:hypothetical protein
MGFGLSLGFTGLLKLVTAISHTIIAYSHTLSLCSLLFLHQMSGNRLQHLRCLSSFVHRLLSSLAQIFHNLVLLHNGLDQFGGGGEVFSLPPMLLSVVTGLQ